VTATTTMQHHHDAATHQAAGATSASARPASLPRTPRSRRCTDQADAVTSGATRAMPPISGSATRPGSAVGFATSGKSSRVLANSSPAVSSTATTRCSTSSGRQRAEGRWPSGNSSRPTVGTRTIAGTHNHPSSQPARTAPGHPAGTATRA
jgi:hypothetical protein